MKADVVVIGGGAAGMMTAATAAARGRRVILLEPQKLCGRKLRITGKGRCNLTNNCEVREFLQNVPENPRFLHSCLNRFPPSVAMDFFEGLGVPIKTERGRRVFPVSDRAADIAEALEKYMLSGGVRVIRAAADDIMTDGGAVTGVSSSRGDIECRAAVVCTGGLSYPLTGSTGDGYRLARELGHTIISPRPSLVPLESGDAFCAELQGLSLRNIRLSVFAGGDRLIYREQGELLFTHFGVSGPLALSASAHMRAFDSEKYRMELDLKPALDEKQLDARLLRDFEKFRNRDFSNALDELAPRSLIPVLVRLSGIPGERKVNSLTRAERQRLLQLFKAFPIAISGPRPIAEAIITAGGVDVGEVNPRTMGSKLVSGLYFAGEVLDLDAYTGGYNLQIAWATGYTAGSCA